MSPITGEKNSAGVGSAMSASNVVLGVAIPAAVAGAASLGLASSAQAVAVQRLDQGQRFHMRWLALLARRRMWLLGIGATAAGFGLQVLALEFGPLLVVQPLLVSNLVFAVVLSAVLMHRTVDWPTVLAAVLCVAGLGALLAFAHPSGGDEVLAPPMHLIPLAVCLVLVALLGIGMSMWVHGPVQVLGLALVTGIGYGVTAGLMKIVAIQARSGLFEPARHWAFYGICLLGPASFLVSQQTFGKGEALAPALAVITTVDPVASAAVGLGWLGERADIDWTSAGYELIAVVAIVVGIVMLSRRTGEPSGAIEKPVPAAAPCDAPPCEPLAA